MAILPPNSSEARWAGRDLGGGDALETIAAIVHALAKGPFLTARNLVSESAFAPSPTGTVHADGGVGPSGPLWDRAAFGLSDHDSAHRLELASDSIWLELGAPLRRRAETDAPAPLPFVLRRLDDYAFPVPDAPVHTGRGTDLLYGSSGPGRDGAGAGRDLVIGRSDVQETLRGGAGADFVFMQGGDTAQVRGNDLFVIALDPPLDASAPRAPDLFLRPDRPGDDLYAARIDLIFNGMDDPAVTHVGRSGLVTVVDADGRTATVQLLDAQGGRLVLSRREADALARDMRMDDTGAPLMAGVVLDGVGGEADEVLIGGAAMAGGGGRDLLVADVETATMDGGPGEDMLVSDPRGVMLDGGAGVDLYVLSGHARGSATADPDCLAWDIVGPEFYAPADLWDFGGTGTPTHPPYTDDVLWLPDLDAATVAVRLDAGGAFVFRDADGTTAEVMFETADGALLGADDRDQLVGRIHAGADAALLQADQFLF